MYSAILECLACRNKGDIELRPGSKPAVSDAYEYLGQSVASGYFYLLCTHCRTVLLVDPAAFMGPDKSEKVKGIICRPGALLYRRANDLSGPEKAR